MDEKQRRENVVGLLDSLSMDELKKRKVKVNMSKEQFEGDEFEPSIPVIEPEGYQVPKVPFPVDLNAPYKQRLKTPSEMKDASPEEKAVALKEFKELMEDPEKTDAKLKRLQELKRYIKDSGWEPEQDESATPPILGTTRA